MSTPSSSTVKTLAQDIVNVISTITHNTETLSAVVDFVPDLPLSKVKQRQIIVTPYGYSRDPLARGRSDVGARIEVGIVEKIALSDVDDRLLLVETIMKALDRLTLTTKAAKIIRIECDPMYDAQILKTTRVFLSVITCTVKVLADD